MTIENPTYLGDAVYATYDDYHVILTTEHHDPKEANNIVYMDKDVIRKLVKWWGEIDDG
jgi:hypothetical protein